MFDEDGAGRRLGAEDAGVLAVLLAAAVGRSALTRSAAASAAFAPLQKRLDLMLQIRNPPTQLSVLGFEFGNPLVARVSHDPHSLCAAAPMDRAAA